MRKRIAAVSDHDFRSPLTSLPFALTLVQPMATPAATVMLLYIKIFYRGPNLHVRSKLRNGAQLAAYQKMLGAVPEAFNSKSNIPAKGVRNKHHAQ